MRIKRISIALVVALLFLDSLMGIKVAYAQVVSKDSADTLQQAKDIMKDMTLEEKIGQMFMLDFRKKDGKDVTVLDNEIVRIIDKYRPGGVILFRENTVETQQTIDLTKAYQKASPQIPLFIAIDQEGGAVTRLQSGTVMPGNMALGATGSLELVYDVAKATADELKVLGINMNFAPVVDVNNNPSNPVIGTRAFGDDPNKVAALGVEFMKGLNDAGVIAAAKHFPGHGDTDIDSHIALPTVRHNIERLEKVELMPFDVMIKNEIDMIMTAHVTFPAIDDHKGVPATLSYKTLTELLREKMGFKGVIISDAFNMQAITERYGDKEATAMAINAGVDIVLMPRELEHTFTYIVEQVKRGAIPKEKIDASVERIIALKIKRGLMGSDKDDNIPNEQQALKIVGGEEHELLKRITAEQAVTLIKNEDNHLPFKLESHKRIVFFVPSQIGVDTVKDALDIIISNCEIKGTIIQGFNYNGQRELTEEQKKAVTQSDYVVLFTRTVSAADRVPHSSFIPDFAADLIDNTNTQGKQLAAVSIRNPYDIQFLQGVKSYIAVYSDWKGGGVQAAVKAVFGKINPVGKLPVSIPDYTGETIYQNGHGLSYSIENVIQDVQ